MSVTGLLITSIMVFIGLYDAVVVMRRGVGCSVSRWAQRTGYSSPIFVLMIGYLLGHFFGAMPIGNTMIAVPEKTDIVTMIPLEETTVYFIPRGTTVHFEKKD